MRCFVFDFLSVVVIADSLRCVGCVFVRLVLSRSNFTVAKTFTGGTVDWFDVAVLPNGDVSRVCSRSARTQTLTARCCHSQVVSIANSGGSFQTFDGATGAFRAPAIALGFFSFGIDVYAPPVPLSVNMTGNVVDS